MLVISGSVGKDQMENRCFSLPFMLDSLKDGRCVKTVCSFLKAFQ